MRPVSTTLTAMPESFAAGSTVKYTSAGGDYRATDGWGRALYLAGINVLTITGVASGADFLMTIPAASSAALASGSYHWEERASKAGEIFTVASGSVSVTPNLATAAAGALQSWEEKALVAIDAVLAGNITSDIESYQIGTSSGQRAVTKIPKKELLTIRSQLAAAVARQKHGGGIGRQHRITFTGARNEGSN